MCVWKQVRRKNDDSSDSSPVTGCDGRGGCHDELNDRAGFAFGVGEEALGPGPGLLEVKVVVDDDGGARVSDDERLDGRDEAPPVLPLLAPLPSGNRGVRDLVMAWTPWNVPARTR